MANGNNKYPPFPPLPGPLSKEDAAFVDKLTYSDTVPQVYGDKERALPENVEGEGVLLALALFFPERYAARVAELAQHDDFYLGQHLEVFDVLKYLVNQGRPINPHTVWAEIRARPKKAATKDMRQLMELKYGIPKEHNDALIVELVNRLRPLAVKRRIGRLVTNIGSQSEDQWATAQDIVAELEIEVEHIVKMMAGLGHERKGFFHVRELMERFDKRLIDFHMGRTDAIPTGLDELDGILNLNGLNRKGVYYIMSRPGVGKTSLGLTWMLNQARMGIPGGYSTLEMDKLVLFQRLYAMYTSIPFWMFRAGMYGKEYEQARAKLAQFAELPLYLMDSSFVSPEIQRYQRQLVFGPASVQCLYTDYLQLIGGAKGKSRYETVTDSSRDQKITAAELNVPNVVMSQLNRDSAREDRPPEMHDARESGQIEQDAEAIAALWERPEEREGNRQRKYKYIEMIILKQRNGPTCLPDGSNIQLVYFKEFMQYMTLGQFRKAQQAAGVDPNRPDSDEETNTLLASAGPIPDGEYDDDF